MYDKYQSSFSRVNSLTSCVSLSSFPSSFIPASKHYTTDGVLSFSVKILALGWLCYGVVIEGVIF